MNWRSYIHARQFQRWRQTFHTPDPCLTDVLPEVDTVAHKDQTFVLLSNGKLGAGFEVMWPYHLTRSDEEIAGLEGVIARALAQSFHQYHLQFQVQKQSGQFTSRIFITTPPIKIPVTLNPSKTLARSQSDFESKAESFRDYLMNLKTTMTSEGATVSYITNWESIFKPLESGVVVGSAISFGEKIYYAIVPQELPAEYSSQVLRPLLFENSKFTLSSGLRVLSRPETEMRIEKRKFWLQNSLGASAARQREEVETFEKSFARGDRLVALTLVVIADELASAKRLQSTLSLCTNSPWMIEVAGAAKVILDAQALQHDSSFMDKIGRTAYLPLATVTRLLPLSSGSVSNGQKPLRYISQEGEASSFDLRDTPGCHTAVIAGTRSGKSFLVANILHKYLDSENPPVVSILDKRASYGALAKKYQGATIAFDMESLKTKDFPFHPFSGPLDAAHIEFLSTYLALLAELAKPDEPVHAVDKVAFTEAISHAIETVKISSTLTKAKASNTLTMSDIASALGRSENPSARTLSSRLKPYYGSGTYAAYFDREHTVSSEESSVISFDLDGLESDPLLQAAISQAVLGQTMARMCRAHKEGRWGILLVEEIGVLGESITGLADFVADAWKTMAKMGVVCVGITNDVEDYLHKPAAKAIWNNSPNKIYLRMTHDQIRSLVTSNEHGPAVVSGQLAELLPCLKTIPGTKADFILTAEEKIYPLMFKPSAIEKSIGGEQKGAGGSL